MYFSSSTPSVSPVPATEDAENVPWLLIYGFIVILVLFFIYSAVRSLIFLYLDPPILDCLWFRPRDIESETSSEFSDRDREEQSNIDVPSVIEGNTAIKQPIGNQIAFNVTSRFEALLRSMVARFFQKKGSKEHSVWHTGAHIV